MVPEKKPTTKQTKSLCSQNQLNMLPGPVLLIFIAVQTLQSGLDHSDCRPPVDPHALLPQPPGFLLRPEEATQLNHLSLSFLLQIFKNIFLFKLPTCVNSITHSYFAFYRFLSFKFLQVAFSEQEDRNVMSVVGS